MSECTTINNLPAIVKAFFPPCIFAPFATAQIPACLFVELDLLSSFAALKVPINRQSTLSFSFLHEPQVPVVFASVVGGIPPTRSTLAPVYVPAQRDRPLLGTLFHQREVPVGVLLRFNGRFGFCTRILLVAVFTWRGIVSRVKIREKWVDFAHSRRVRRNRVSCGASSYHFEL